MKQFLDHNRSIVVYSASLGVLLLLLKWLEWRMLVIDHAIEMYAGAVALLFTALGI